jgi:hypothetical protein
MSKSHSESRSENSPKPLHPFQAVVIIFAFLWLGTITFLAQGPDAEFRTALSTKAGFTSDDWFALERGETVIKRLPVTDNREVAVCGLARLQGTPGIIAKAFKQSMAQQHSKSILAIGNFSNPPTLADVGTLSLENRDIEDLKQCMVGKCELKLSAAMIGRFQKGVNWSSLDYKRQATSLFKEMLLDYVRDYLARGDAALIEYHDQRRAISVREEQQALLDRMLYIPDFAPEFVSYLTSFPNSKLSQVESHINWTKLKFGLKPVIIVTHVATHTRLHNDAQQILTVSKQIYANHYFDSSLSLTAVINIPTAGGSPDSYLLYTNASRADSLSGSFSRIRRGLVESESAENLRELVQQTRSNVEVIAANHSGSGPAPRQSPVSDWLFRGTRLYGWLFVLVVLVFLVVLVRRRPRRRQVRPSRVDPTTGQGA